VSGGGSESSPFPIAEPNEARRSAMKKLVMLALAAMMLTASAGFARYSMVRGPGDDVPECCKNKEACCPSSQCCPKGEHTAHHRGIRV
jgi:hypothetical protein